MVMRPVFVDRNNSPAKPTAVQFPAVKSEQVAPADTGNARILGARADHRETPLMCWLSRIHRRIPEILNVADYLGTMLLIPKASPPTFEHVRKVGEPAFCRRSCRTCKRGRFTADWSCRRSEILPGIPGQAEPQQAVARTSAHPAIGQRRRRTAHVGTFIAETALEEHCDEDFASRQRFIRSLGMPMKQPDGSLFCNSGTRQALYQPVSEPFRRAYFVSRKTLQTGTTQRRWLFAVAAKRKRFSVVIPFRRSSALEQPLAPDARQTRNSNSSSSSACRFLPSFGAIIVGCSCCNIVRPVCDAVVESTDAAQPSQRQPASLCSMTNVSEPSSASISGNSWQSPVYARRVFYVCDACLKTGAQVNGQLLATTDPALTHNAEARDDRSKRVSSGKMKC